MRVARVGIKTWRAVRSGMIGALNNGACAVRCMMDVDGLGWGRGAPDQRRTHLATHRQRHDKNTRHPLPAGLIHYLYYKWIDRRFPYHLFPEEKFGKPEGTFYKVLCVGRGGAMWLLVWWGGVDTCMGGYMYGACARHAERLIVPLPPTDNGPTAERGVVQVLDRVAHHRRLQGACVASLCSARLGSSYPLPSLPGRITASCIPALPPRSLTQLHRRLENNNTQIASMMFLTAFLGGDWQGLPEKFKKRFLLTWLRSLQGKGGTRGRTDATHTCGWRGQKKEGVGTQWPSVGGTVPSSFLPPFSLVIIISPHAFPPLAPLSHLTPPFLSPTTVWPIYDTILYAYVPASHRPLFNTFMSILWGG